MVKKLTLAEARKEIADREKWLWRQKNWDNGRGDLPGNERDFADQDYPGTGLEAGFWDIPNM